MTLMIRYSPQLVKWLGLFSNETGVWNIKIYDDEPSPVVALHDFLGTASREAKSTGAKTPRNPAPPPDIDGIVSTY